jgi:predicted DNA-binding transcriptional regulator AlpA
MSTDASGPGTISPVTVSVSRWVNERYPPWTELLTSHEVACLTRRHRWILAAMALMGRFPQRFRIHGRPIGWLRTDVECWLGRNCTVTRLAGQRHWPGCRRERQRSSPDSHSGRQRIPCSPSHTGYPLDRLPRMKRLAKHPRSRLIPEDNQ